MKLARYIGKGQVEIVDEPRPVCPPGGVLVQTEACGLCTGELMDWYMERKLPHVLGHEVAGRVAESDHPDFPVGVRVAVHHHAPCFACAACARQAYVHCPTWKRTRLVPGGMADFFAASPENLRDAYVCDDLEAEQAALMEPIACVHRSLGQLGTHPGERIAIIGLGFMGLAHALLTPGAVGIELSEVRREHAATAGVLTLHPDQAESESFDGIVVCPGGLPALSLALKLIAPRGRIVLFAPVDPGARPDVDWQDLYFREVSLRPSYSADPENCRAALATFRDGKLHWRQLVTDRISLAELPQAYGQMKRGEILKAMAIW